MSGLIIGAGASIAEKIAGNAIAKRATSIVTAIPKPVWEALTVVAYVIALIATHQHYANAAIKRAYASGYAQALKDVDAAAKKKAAQLQTLKHDSEAKIDSKDQGVRENAQRQNTHIDANVAQLLGMWAPHDQAAGGDYSRSGRGVPQADGAAGAVHDGARVDDGLAASSGQSAGEPTIALPAVQLIARAGTCDREHIALKAWEQTFRNYTDEYNAWLLKTQKVAK